MQQYFAVTAPAVHGMVLTLERQGLITREPGAFDSPYRPTNYRCSTSCWPRPQAARPTDRNPCNEVLVKTASRLLRREPMEVRPWPVVKKLWPERQTVLAGAAAASAGRAAAWAAAGQDATSTTLQIA